MTGSLANVPKVPHVPMLVAADHDLAAQHFWFAHQRIDIFVGHAIAFVEEREFRLLRRRDDKDAVALLRFQIEPTADDAADPFRCRLARKVFAETAIEDGGDLFDRDAGLRIGLREQTDDDEQLSFETGITLALQTVGADSRANV